MKTFLSLIVLLFATPAWPCDWIDPVGSLSDGIVEIAGCSTQTGVFELHHSFSPTGDSLPADPPWDGSGWASLWTRSDSYYEYRFWDDANGTTPRDECDDRAFHGDGNEALQDVTCGQVWSLTTFPTCAYEDFTTDPRCISGWYQLDKAANHPSFKLSPNADVDRNGVVGASDSAAVAQCFGMNVSTCTNPNADVDNNGVVGASDVAAVSNHFGDTLTLYTTLGHEQWYYDDVLPCPEGNVLCYMPYGGEDPSTARIWVQEQ